MQKMGMGFNGCLCQETVWIGGQVTIQLQIGDDETIS